MVSPTSSLPKVTARKGAFSMGMDVYNPGIYSAGRSCLWRSITYSDCQLSTLSERRIRAALLELLWIERRSCKINWPFTIPRETLRASVGALQCGICLQGSTKYMRCQVMACSTFTPLGNSPIVGPSSHFPQSPSHSTTTISLPFSAPFPSGLY